MAEAKFVYDRKALLDGAADRLEAAQKRTKPRVPKWPAWAVTAFFASYALYMLAGAFGLFPGSTSFPF